MTSGLVHASYSLPEWQAVKTDFLCTLGGDYSREMINSDIAHWKSYPNYFVLLSQTLNQKLMITSNKPNTWAFYM